MTCRLLMGKKVRKPMDSKTNYASLVPIPPADAHKYSRGKAIVVAGSAAYPGAACLSSCATQLAGAGYTQVFTAKSNMALIQAFRPSLVVGSFASLDVASALPAQHSGAFVVGPGFDSSDADAENVARCVLKQASAPVLVDGGALAFMPSLKMRKVLRRRNEQGSVTVLTPHKGEAARLGAPFGLNLDNMQQEEGAYSLALAYGAVVVLKGPDTVIASVEHSCRVTNGSAALAKAGTGDVLAGVIGGLLAQGMSAFDAAHLGVYIHAEAGNIAAERKGVVSTCAEDVLDALPEAFMRIGK